MKTTLLCSKDLCIKLDEAALLLTINGEQYKEMDDQGNAKSLTFTELQTKANYEKRKLYTSFLSQQFENLCILSGAGTSYGIGLDTKKGKTMSGLWESVSSLLGKEGFSTFCAHINYDIKKNNLEELLGQASRAVHFYEAVPPILKIIKDNIDLIHRQIKNDCSLKLPTNSPHATFLNKVGNRKLKYLRTRLFTLNYDTLFEQAADQIGCTLIDGFSFTKKGVFRGYCFDYDLVIREKSRIRDEENYVPKVMHLYKLHGSIDWCVHENNIIRKEDPESPLLIFPADSKYELSYEQPFFEMMSRFQENLRKSNTTLICLGFSLNDKHIRKVIQDAVAFNPGFRLMLVDHDISSNDHWNWFKQKAKNDSRILLVSEDFVDFANYFPDQVTMTHEERLREQYGKL